MVTYCSAEDVKRILTLEFSFDPKTRPSDAEVNSFILSAEQEIDNRTNTAWRETNVAEEYYDIPSVEAFNYSTGLAIYLKRNAIRTLDTGQGDKVELWNGSSYEDWVTTKTEGRADDFWLDYTKGIIYLKNFYAYHRVQALRMTYRYGNAVVPPDIKDACAMLSAVNIVIMDKENSVLSETGDVTQFPNIERARALQNRARQILKNYTWFRAF